MLLVHQGYNMSMVFQENPECCAAYEKFDDKPDLQAH